MEQGKVWLVGAGPGEQGLFTLKGKSVLEAAQIVVYDALVGNAVLSLIPQEAKTVYVGKRASKHTLSQKQINEVLINYAKQGKRVVRLKGGDPFLFGRGGEEIEELRKAKIPFEVVPGVPSALAVPAYFGIPVTHRDFCSSVHIITGHQKKDTPLQIDFRGLLSTGGTYVFLMGVSALKEICQGFLKAGMEGDMPAAVLSRGTTALQEKRVATVATLEQVIEKNPIPTPAIIVIGKVCGLSEEFDWYKEMPLSYLRIVVTRPREHMGKLFETLRKLGAEVIEVPTIQTIIRTPDMEQEQAFDRLSQYQWLVFTSPIGVKCFFEILKNRKQDIRSFSRAKIAAIGEGTRAELLEHGILVDLMPEIYDGVSLGKAMAGVLSEHDRVLLPRAEKGNQELVAQMKQAKAGTTIEITDLPIYDTLYQQVEAMNLWEVMEGNTIAVFTSSSTVRGFQMAAPELDFTRVRAVCIGKQTADTAKTLGMQVEVAKKATMESLVEKIVEIYGTQENL